MSQGVSGPLPSYLGGCTTQEYPSRVNGWSFFHFRGVTARPAPNPALGWGSMEARAVGFTVWAAGRGGLLASFSVVKPNYFVVWDKRICPGNTPAVFLHRFPRPTRAQRGLSRPLDPAGTRCKKNNTNHMNSTSSKKNKTILKSV